MSDKTEISISTELVNMIKQKIKNPQTGFDSVEDYVNYVLKEILMEDSDIEEEVSPEETERIKEELKKMGYI